MGSGDRKKYIIHARVVDDFKAEIPTTLGYRKLELGSVRDLWNAFDTLRSGDYEEAQLPWRDTDKFSSLGDEMTYCCSKANPIVLPRERLEGLHITNLL